jgi:MGT family glycosyltransferase
MSTYLVTCTPAHGHVSPLLVIARHLVERGHRVLFLTSVRYGDRVAATGAEFVPLPTAADVDLDAPDAAFPERAGLTGSAAIRFDMLHLFLAPGRAQYDALTALLARERVDAVLTEQLFVGAVLLNERPRTERPPIVALGILPLGVKSRDTAPFGLGIPPRAGALGRLRNALLGVIAEKGVFGPVSKAADALAREVIGRPLSRFLLDWSSAADALVQFIVPAFEYPRSDLPSAVRFAGPLPAPRATGALPVWWDDLEGRTVVHVTQGTVANVDLGQLVLPTIEGMAASDLLVVVSTGGRPVEALGMLPPHVRAAEYLPYELLLPRVSAMVTNGGYGGVQLAVSHGIPIVIAGRTEDKVEVSARVAWSGVGIDLRTNTPSAEQVAGAVHRVLAEPSYREAAGRIGADIAAAPGLAGLDTVLAELREGASVRVR